MVEWPGRRADVIEALALLAALRDVDPGQWPDLTAAVHWLVDDTGWDEGGSAGAIGTILRDEGEVAAVDAVVVPLVRVLDDLGPAPDADYLAHPSWSGVRDAAGRALERLRAHGTA